jgi:hypothetical protein
MERLRRETVLDDTIASETNSTAVDLNKATSFSCIAAITDSTPAAGDDFLAGESEVNTLTFEAKASMDDGEYLVITDTNGDLWAIAADLTGSSAEPTGAIWLSIDSGKKDQVDLSGVSTAIEVAAAFESQFNGLSGFSSLVTLDDSAADGTMTVTHVARGPVANAQSLLEDDGGAGGIGVAETNPGIASTVDISADSITIVGHGYETGLKGQASSTGTLPSGLSVSTDYFVIVVDVDTIKLASSLANALAGTQIDLTDQGTDGATHTFTATALAGGSVKLEGSIDGSTYAIVSDSTQSVTASGNFFWNKPDPGFQYVRFVITVTAGQLDVVAKIQSVGEGE